MPAAALGGGGGFRVSGLGAFWAWACGGGGVLVQASGLRVSG